MLTGEAVAHPPFRVGPLETLGLQLFGVGGLSVLAIFLG